MNPGVNAAGSVNGTRTNSVNWQINGADNNDQWHNSAAVNQGGVSGIAGTLLPIDSIDEFSIQTNGNAEQGRNGGGTLNVVIKSGTNSLHGSLYYFNRNEFLAAQNWFVANKQKLRNNQYQISQATVFELGYTGTFSRNLPVTVDINQTPIGGATRPYAASFPTLATINEIQSVGSGYYNGMVASLRTANYHGLLAKLNYTYGHARDDLSATRGAIPQNSYNIRGDYGNADFDIRHSFVGFVSYSLPTPSHAKLLLGGWQLNSLLSFYTGTPFTVYSGTNTSGTKENKDRAEVTGDPYQNVPASKQPN